MIKVLKIITQIQKIPYHYNTIKTKQQQIIVTQQMTLYDKKQNKIASKAPMTKMQLFLAFLVGWG